MHGALTTEQHDELDRWVEESEDNQELFAAATDEDHIKATFDKIIYGPDYVEGEDDE